MSRTARSSRGGELIDCNAVIEQKYGTNHV